MKQTLILVGICCSLSNVFGQRTSYFGMGSNYNVPLSEPGIELRMEHFLRTNFTLVPQMSYFPGVNNIHELFLGGNINYFPFEKANKSIRSYRYKFKPYVYFGAAYNNWINANPLTVSNLKTHNIIPQAGVGLNFGGYVFRGFSEFNYNVLANEGVVKLGVLFSPNHFKIKKKSDCP